MTALENAARLISELDEHNAEYKIMIPGPGALLVSVHVLGGRWEFGFSDDGRVALERFASEGVDDQDYDLGETAALLRSHLGGVSA